jgi:hypothetical protein
MEANTDDDNIEVITGQGGSLGSDEVTDGDEQRSITDLVEQPAKVMRIGTMIKQLLEEVKAAPLDDASRSRLREICLSDLSDGGRGIRNQLEAHLVNPLARLLFDNPGEGPLVINTITLEGGLTVLHPSAAGEG